ncbi:MAG: putative transport system permease protein [Thermoanaerobaculia bacterium]|jgi:putative ABC transport system permease protein|nr:putative transport system permease protein [Thermoanaerobaculia bacterium]
MRDIAIELTESFRIAFGQIRAHKMRSILTALGVIIGIIAVTLMGSAIGGIEIGFERSLAVIGDDILYVEKWPWHNVDDWWNYRNRRRIEPQYADTLKRLIAATPNSNLITAVPTLNTNRGVKYGDNEVQRVFTQGTTEEFLVTSTATFKEGRFITAIESRGARNVCVLGFDVADALFPKESALDKTVMIGGSPFRVIGVFGKQGTFLGLFSFDTQVVVPLGAFTRAFSSRLDTSIRVKVKDKAHLAQARDELTGDMRRVRGLRPEQKDDFEINAQEGLRSTIEPVKAGIAVAGLFITSLALFVGAIGIMNITYVSVKERTREIGTRKAVGARRRTILMQFLVEAICICLIGGAAGLLLSFLLTSGVAAAFPSFPMQFSAGLVIVGMIVSTLTGILSGFAPALSASRLDPIEALRYE